MLAQISSVFLSYASADRDAVRKIVDHIRQAGFRVWDPDIEILPGDDWTAGLKQGLESSDAMVVFLSPEASQSREVNREIEYALGAEHLSWRLVPVMLRPTRKYPWILRRMQMIHHATAKQTGQAIVAMLRQPQHVLAESSQTN